MTYTCQILAISHSSLKPLKVRPLLLGPSSLFWSPQLRLPGCCSRKGFPMQALRTDSQGRETLQTYNSRTYTVHTDAALQQFTDASGSISYLYLANTGSTVPGQVGGLRHHVPRALPYSLVTTRFGGTLFSDHIVEFHTYDMLPVRDGFKWCILH